MNEHTLQFSKKDTAAIKGIAIIAMMLHHCFLETSRFEAYNVSFYPFNQDFVVKIADVSKFCVGIFVFLSAYGMAHSFLNLSPTLDFSSAKARKLTLKRYISMMSGFLIAYLFCFIGSCIFTPTPLTVYKEENTFPLYMLFDMLGISDLMGTPTLIGTWWYMGLAVTMICFFPMILKAYSKCGILLAPALLCILAALGLPITRYSRWILLIPIGILFADRKVMEKLKAWHISRIKIIDLPIRFAIVSFFLYWSFVYASWNYGKLNYMTPVLDLFVTMTVIIWSYLFLTDIPVLRQILQFLGKHSMNIFLIHSFIRGKWFVEYTYSFGHFVPIILILLAESTCISIVLEALKNYSGYNNLVQKLIRTVTAD